MTPPSGRCSSSLTSGVEVRRRSTDRRLLDGRGAVDNVGPSAASLALPLRDHLLTLLHWLDEKLLLLHPDHAGLEEGEMKGIVQDLN